ARAVADPDQPRQQRHQVHRARLGRDQARRAPGGGRARRRDQRHRHRGGHPREGPGEAVPGVPADGVGPPPRGHRPRPARVAEARRPDRRAHRVHQRLRQGQPLHPGRARRAEGVMSARVLVIEDNRANLELMTYLLRAYKHEPVSAEDGETGLELARSGRPDVVICDIQLPGIDGYEVLRRLKSDAATRAIPVVAVTAFAMVGDRDRALAAGFDGYIGKPIVPETFVSQVERFIAGAPAAAAPTWGHPPVAEKTAPARHAGARVLVVDNTAANREFIAGALGALGYAVVTASNAASGLQTARTLRPDLIISDMHMPGIDGCEFLAHV